MVDAPVSNPPTRCRIGGIKEIREVDRVQERGQLRDVGVLGAQRGQRHMVFQLDPAQLGGRQRQ
ncbi:hypothetical protein [Burkholderia cenocepacia]|uniref:hypothetical protein n=1 Tax=Burkholderia cenocepacia TaxID=95486 RepID=UPI001905F919|nr:hypothetical protein [Burkholderia cenocepacia]MBJ9920526.1 hypothetical protein [Burkholderia cenocepacia]